MTSGDTHFRKSMPSVADIGLMGTLGCLLASLQGRDRQAQTQQSGGCCPSPRTAMRHGLSSHQHLTVLCFTRWSPPDVTSAAGPHVCRHQAGTQPHARLSPGEGHEHALPSSCRCGLKLCIRNQSSARLPAGSVPQPSCPVLPGSVGGRRDPHGLAGAHPPPQLPSASSCSSTSSLRQHRGLGPLLDKGMPRPLSLEKLACRPCREKLPQLSNTQEPGKRGPLC